MGETKQFNIQLQFKRDIRDTRGDYVAELSRMIDSSAGKVGTVWTDGDKKGSYVNLNVMVERPFAFWASLIRQITSQSVFNFSDIMIATCQGERGWDDHLLVHHFDRKQELDTLPHDKIEARP